MDASLDDQGGWSVEAGAAFDNGTALASAIEAAEDIRITEVVGEQENGGVVTYVKTEGFVEETTEEAVRSRDQVGDQTTVNLPGNWDRDFPEMDRQAAADYLGVEVEGGDEGGSPLPGFGFAVALVALTVAAVVVGRRRD
jgi:PGF-CTERM protein